MSVSEYHSGLDIRLLGPAQVRRDGVDLGLGTPRRVAVFCALALRSNRTVPRDQLINAVWGDDPPASATGNVYTYISELRRLLEPSRDKRAARRLLASVGGSYRLHARSEQLDVFRFEALRGEGKKHRMTGNTAAELVALQAAMRLWDGEALAGVPGPFAAAERLRLTELRLVTAERLATLLLRARRHRDAVALLRELVEAHPMRAGLKDLLQAARTGVVQPSITHKPSCECLVKPNLVGREAELGVLRRAVARVATGRGRSLQVVGGPGIGKTALLHTALLDAVPAGRRIGYAVGDELTYRMPLEVLLECVDSAMHDTSGRAFFLQLYTIAGEVRRQPRGVTVERAVAVIRAAVRDAPLTLVVDAFQWADPFTLDVWAALQAETGLSSLLLVASGGPGRPALPADDVIELGPLTTEAAAALLRRAAPALDERELPDLIADAGGNPTYLRHMAVSRTALRAAVEEHLAPFSEQARVLLRAIAFLGVDARETRPSQEPGCGLSELCAATQWQRIDVQRVLDPLVASRVLRMSGGRVAFQHRVVGRVLYDATATQLRSALRRLFAERIAVARGASVRVTHQLVGGSAQLNGNVANGQQ